MAGKRTIQTAVTVTDPELLKLQEEYLGHIRSSLISSPTPKEVILHRRGRGGDYDYVPVYYFVTRANALFGYLWDVVVEREGILEEDMEVEDSSKIDPNAPKKFGPRDVLPTKTVKQKTQVYCEGYVSITIPGKTITQDGITVKTETVTIRKHAFGGKDIAYYGERHPLEGMIIDIADDFKGAEADLLKKGLSYLGMQVDVYGKREIEELGIGLSDQQEKILIREGAYLGGTPELILEKLTKMADEMYHKSLESLTQVEFMTLLRKVKEGKPKTKATPPAVVGAK